MRVKFWGTRGSIAVPGQSTLIYGGNTPCVEVRSDAGTLIILDCGTGLRMLGQSLLAAPQRPLAGHILLTHTHWDHIQGFPFFAPAFMHGNTFSLYAPHDIDKRLEEVLAGQMEYTYFPVTLSDLGARISFHELGEETFTIDDVTISSHYLNHTSVALGYRITCDGASVAYITDHEPYLRYPTAGRGRIGDTIDRDDPVHHEEQALVEFVQGVDLLIQDSQFTEEEYATKVNWGHGTMDYCIEVAMQAGARRLALFHHDPSHTDTILEDLVAQSQHNARLKGADHLAVFAAAEGDEILLMGHSDTISSEPSNLAGTRITSATILIVDDDPQISDMIIDALRADGYRLLIAGDGATGLEVAQREHPDLLIVDAVMPEKDGYALVADLRQDSMLYDVPIIMLTARTDPEDTRRGYAVGISDYMVKPFSPAVLRSRVRTWLGRGTGQTRIYAPAEV